MDGIYHPLLADEVILVNVVEELKGGHVNLESDDGYRANNIPVVETIDVTTSSRWFCHTTKKAYAEAVLAHKNPAPVEDADVEIDDPTDVDDNGADDEASGD